MNNNQYLKIEHMLHQLANLSERARVLNQNITQELEYLGVDTSTEMFVNCFGYVENDHDIEPLMNYIKGV